MAAMAHDHSHHAPTIGRTTDIPRYRRILWWSLAINAAMFLVELFASYQSGSVALMADAIDFAGDAANYGVSIAVLTAAASLRARTALLKAFCMAGFGLFVLGRAVWSWNYGSVPDAPLMGGIATLALMANLGVAWMLYAFREGDANMRSVWLCSRNDAISNIAVMVAALGVFGSQSAWPDLLVASVMAVLALSSAYTVFGHARVELRQQAGQNHVH